MMTINNFAGLATRRLGFGKETNTVLSQTIRNAVLATSIMMKILAAGGSLLLLLSILTSQTTKSFSMSGFYKRASLKLMSTPSKDTLPTTLEAIKFTGGGIYFWYQAGCVKYLVSSGRKLKDNVKIIGSSAGSLLSAT